MHTDNASTNVAHHLIADRFCSHTKRECKFVKFETQQIQELSMTLTSNFQNFPEPTLNSPGPWKGEKIPELSRTFQDAWEPWITNVFRSKQSTTDVGINLQTSRATFSQFFFVAQKTRHEL